MLKKFSLTVAGIFSALALTLAMASPALAYHCGCRGMPPGMQGGGMGAMHGACGCPQMQYRPCYSHGPACDLPRRAAPDNLTAASGKALGVMVGNLSDEDLDALGLNYGVEVKSVQLDTAAAAAGIQADDLILEFAGKPVTSVERLRWLIRKAEADKSLEIKLLRDDKPLTVNATLKAPEAKPACNMEETKANGS